jgi:beta-lactamase superfamily II metal-dependent hydrolase
MPYNGLEIDMLALGDADSLLISRWANGNATRILVDGGYARHAEDVRRFLAERNISHIDHVVSSHFHSDHAEGLVDLVQDQSLTFGEAWVHLPENHVDMNAVGRALKKTGTLKESRLITASIDTERQLVAALRARRIKITEPFQGRSIDWLSICGPAEHFYEQLLAHFEDVDKIMKLDEERGRREARDLIEKTAARRGGTFDDQLLADPKTGHENDSSTILFGVFDGHRVLLTADAGAKALGQALLYKEIDNLHWMQIPHHGSRYNITRDLIQRFRPNIGNISAGGAGNHPHNAVVRAFKEAGTTLFSTHHPTPTALWFAVGEVPSRGGYCDAAPL